MNACESLAEVCGGAGGGGVAATTFAAALQLLAHSQCLLTESWPPQATLHNESTVDIIIVGSGSAGSTLAARLAETNLTVLLLEAGGDPPLESIVPGFRRSLLRGQYDWNLTTVDDQYSSQELANRRRRPLTGRVLGGSASVNNLVYGRPYPADCDHWADILKDPTWNWNNVLPYFKKTEKMTDESIANSSSTHYHGYEGDLHVSSVKTPVVMKLLENYAEIGFKVFEDRNNPEKLGAYHMSFTVKDGKRHSPLTAMLNKVANRKNLYVLKNVFVTKVLIKNNTAYGVQVLVGRDEFEFYANKEVIVSAGVYNTPKLLMLSGIGPKSHLENLGIDVVADLSVGNNLRDHLTFRTFLAAESGMCPPDETYFEVIKYLYNRTGSLSTPSYMVADYVLSGSTTPHLPDFAIFTDCVPKGSDFLNICLQNYDFTHEMCQYLDSINEKYELFPTTLVLRQTKSRGFIRLASVDPLENPIINSEALNPEDYEGFPEVLEKVWSLKNTSYFKSKNAFFVDFKVKGCERLDWPEDVKCVVRNLLHTQSHAVGTAAMGTVLDSRLRMRGVRRLRVVDGSAMPTSVRATTNAVIIMLAEKAADFIKEDYGLLEHYHL